jgi:hypothetical protein
MMRTIRCCAWWTRRPGAWKIPQRSAFGLASIQVPSIQRSWNHRPRSTDMATSVSQSVFADVLFHVGMGPHRHIQFGRVSVLDGVEAPGTEAESGEEAALGPGWRGVRRTRPVTIPGPGRHAGRSASCRPSPDDIVCVPIQLRFCGRNATAEFGCEGNPRADLRTFLFSFLGAAANGFQNPQIQKPIMKPIILHAPNRDANSAKSIRPGQAMFSGLQNAPDSDRFTLLIRRFWVRIPGGAPGQSGFLEMRS